MKHLNHFRAAGQEPVAYGVTFYKYYKNE